MSLTEALTHDLIFLCHSLTLSFLGPFCNTWSTISILHPKCDHVQTIVIKDCVGLVLVLCSTHRNIQNLVQVYIPRLQAGGDLHTLLMVSLFRRATRSLEKSQR